jgi:hypothetical protein
VFADVAPRFCLSPLKAGQHSQWRSGFIVARELASIDLDGHRSQLYRRVRAPHENGWWCMALPRCPYCRETFVPSHYHPDQAVCGAPDCQRLRRAAYHRAKFHSDPSYRAQCRDSQKQWREQHPEYMRAYRQSQPARQPAVRPDTEQRTDLVSLLERVKNNVAIDLSACAATVLFVSNKQRVKNILASVQLILIEELPKPESPKSAS